MKNIPIIFQYKLTRQGRINDVLQGGIGDKRKLIKLFDKRFYKYSRVIDGELVVSTGFFLLRFCPLVFLEERHKFSHMLTEDEVKEWLTKCLQDEKAREKILLIFFIGLAVIIFIAANIKR